MEDIIFKVIAEFGFPAFIAMYLIIKTTKAIDNNTAALKNLEKQIEKFLNK